MRAIITTDRAHARRLLRLTNDLESLPRKGVPLTPGRVTISETPGPGWTLRATDAVEHPTDGRLALLAPDELLAAMTDPDKRRRLTSAERAELDASRAQVAELSDDWREDSPDGDRALRRVALEPEQLDTRSR